jgi:hypothetical protein
MEAYRRLDVDMVVGLILPNPDSKTLAEVDHKHHQPYSSPEQVRDHVLSLPSADEVEKEFDETRVDEEYRELLAWGQKECGEAVWIPNGVGTNCAGFDYCNRYGYENYVMALTLYPEAMERLFTSGGVSARAQNRVVADVMRARRHVPLVWTGTDACDNRGPFVDPDILRRIYFPHLESSLAPLKDAGIKIIWHADGNFMPIAQDLIDAGVDGFQGIQEDVEIRVEIGDLDELRTTDAERPLIMGSVSSVTTLPFGTSSDVAAEVRRWQGISKRREGGVFINSSSSLGPEVPIDNIYALFQNSAGVEAT